MQHRYLLAALLLLAPLSAVRAQNVGIGTTTPDASAALEIKAADKGLLPPRLTAAQREAISSPAAGLLVYQTDGTPGYYYFNGTAWLSLTEGTQPDATGALPASPSYGLVSTLAGTGTTGSADGAVTAATFSRPFSVAVGPDGAVYVADQSANKIRLIRNGQVSTLAGSGTNGYANGPAATAEFRGPSGVAVAPDGSVYVADEGNHRIRLIRNGQVSDYAGNGATGTANGPLASASFDMPTCLALGSDGALYVSDQGANRIRVVRNGQVSTLAGNGSSGAADGPAANASFYVPYGVAVDARGAVYVADLGNYRIRLIRNGQVSTLAGSSVGNVDGPVATARFSLPFGVAVDQEGAVYVADWGNNTVRLIRNGQVSTLAGSGANTSVDGIGPAASFQAPAGVAVDAQGTVYVAEYGGRKVRLIGGPRAPLPTLGLSGQTLSIAGGNSVTLPTQSLSVSGQTLSISGGNSVTLPAGADNLGNHTATGPLKYSTNDADKILFTQAMGANGPKLEHAVGWQLNYYAGPNNAQVGVHRFLTGTASGWQERLRIAPSGNVGIGTDTPERTLDVNGSIRQQTYSSGVINLSATSVGAFDWNHGLGYQPILMLTVDQTGGTGAEYVATSYEHLNNSTIRFRLRNNRNSAATFTLHWIRVN